MQFNRPFSFCLPSCPVWARFTLRRLTLQGASTSKSHTKYPVALFVVAACLLAFLSGITGLNAQNDAARPHVRVQEKMQRIRTGIQQWANDGRSPHPVGEIMREFGPLMEAGKVAEAEAVLNRALEMLQEETPSVSGQKPPADTPAPPLAADVLITPAQPVQLGNIPATAEIVFHQNGHIYVMDSKGEGVTQITFGERRPWEHAAVSYDRRYVVGNANTPHPKGGHHSQLWLFDLEKGTEARLLPNFHSAGGGGVDWDPNGFIYFAAIEKRPAPSRDLPRAMALADDIYCIRSDGTGLKRLTQDTDVAEADIAIAEDGSLVVYAAAAGMGTPEQRAEIWVMNADGTNQRRVHRGGPKGAEDEGAHDPELSPDNRQVVFSKVNSTVPPNWPQIGGLNTAHDLWVANIDGTGLRRLTRTRPISIIPDWQGERVVFDERSEKDNYQGAAIVSASGTDQTPRRIKPGARMPKWIPVLTSSAQSRAAVAPVSSDAARKLEGLIVCAEAGPHRPRGPSGLFSIQADGSGKKRLTESHGRDAFPAWSRDGKKIAFASNRAGKFEIWVMDADGGGQKQLTHAPEDAVGRARWVNAVPSWSPDGREIAFGSARSGTMEIWAMGADGDSPLQLTHAPTGKSSNAPNWSPDGRKIAFASDRSGTVQIYTMDPDGGNVVQLTQSIAPDFPDANVPVWSPDSRQIAFWSGVEHRTGQVWVMNTDGSDRRQLTKARGNSDNPAWSPDGSRIIFETGRSGIDVETWIMNADGSNERRLFNFPYGAGRLPWRTVFADPGGQGNPQAQVQVINQKIQQAEFSGASPEQIEQPPKPDPECLTTDTKQFDVKNGLIAFTLRDGDGKLQIFTQKQDGSNRRQLTFEGDNGRPDWSPDGRRIAYGSIRSGRSWVAVMDADGSNPRLVAEGHGDPDWSPDGSQIAFSRPGVSADGRMQSQIWLMNADGSKLRRIAQSCTSKAGPSWSPDGTQMAFILARNPGSRSDPRPQIGIMNADGTSERILTTESRVNVRHEPDGTDAVLETANDANAPAWSPVDNRIAFWSGIETRYGQVWVINSDGTMSTQLTDDPTHRNSDDPSWSPDGKNILFSTGRSGRNELWMMDADGDNERKLSEINASPFPGRAAWQPLRDRREE